MQALDSQIASAGDGRGARPSPRRHTRGLLLVGLFKLSKAVFFGAVGVGALHLIHRNIAAIMMRIVNALPIDPESHVVNMLMDRADLIGGHQLRQFSMLTFAYAALCLVEGTGLMLEKVWAEYFTITLTILGLPWESYELIKRFALYKVAILLVNIAVLVYLVWLRSRKRAQQPASHRGG